MQQNKIHVHKHSRIDHNTANSNTRPREMTNLCFDVDNRTVVDEFVDDLAAARRRSTVHRSPSELSETTKHRHIRNGHIPTMKRNGSGNLDDVTTTDVQRQLWEIPNVPITVVLPHFGR